MAITILSIDSQSIVKFSTSATAVSVTRSTSGLVFTESGSSTTYSCTLSAGWAGIAIPDGVTLTIAASLANNKSFPAIGTNGSGRVVAVASPAGDSTLNSLTLFVNTIQLASGQSYTLTADQAKIARMDASGMLGNLVSTGAITVIADPGSDLTSLTLDGGDSVVLATGGDYILTAAQAMIARVKATGTVKDLSTAGALTIYADTTAGDLSSLILSSDDTLILGAGKDYVLSTQQATIAKVGAGQKGVLATAGTVTIKAAPGGDPNLFSLSATGTDILQLTAGSNYTLTVAQAALSRIGDKGQIGDLTSAGVITIKADTAGADLTGVVTDSNDVLQLGTNLPYTLTTAQAARASVISASGVLGKAGDLTNAGTITLVANPAGEALNATLAAATGYDFLLLSPGKDYVLTSAQAKMAKVGSAGNVGQLEAAGAVTLVVSGTGEDLSALCVPTGSQVPLPPGKVSGIDYFVLAATAAYTLTAEQAAVSRVGINGKLGDLSNTGVITVMAGVGTDLSPIVLDATDILVLASGMAYTMTSSQALIARMGVATATAGQLAKTASVQIKANPAGEDLSQISGVTGVTSIVLTPGQKYTLSTSQIAKTQVGTGGTPGVLTGAGTLTAKAAASEDLTGYASLPVDAYLLTTAQTYKLTADQAFKAKIGTAGLPGDLRQTAGASPWITVYANTAQDLSKLVTDASNAFVLVAGQAYTLTPAQASSARMGESGTTGVLTSSAQITVKASSASADLSGITLDIGDQILLGAGFNYTLSASHVPLAKVGTATLGDLSKTGQLTVKAAALGEDLTAIASNPGIDAYVLTAAAPYTLTAAQAAISTIGPASATNKAGNLVSAAQIIVKAMAAADLSSLALDSGDQIWLQPGLNYTLTPQQASIAMVMNGSGIPGPVGVLDAAGWVTVKTTATDTNLTTLPSSLTGVDAIVLLPAAAMTLTAAQALKSSVGSTGQTADLTSAGTITLLAQQTTDLSAIRLNATSGVQLLDGQDYTLTSAQAAQATVVKLDGKASAKAVLTSTGALRVQALPGSDLTPITLDGGDSVILAPGQKYTLSSAQARIAKVVNGANASAVGDLRTAGAVKVIASGAAEDLSDLSLDASDSIVLTDKVNYVMTAAQAAIAQIGATGARGNLTGTGAAQITVNASGAAADLSGLQMDAGDKLILSPSLNYSLNKQQAAIAQFDATGTPGDLTSAGTITVMASASGDSSLFSATPGADAYLLSPAQNYTLTAAQAAISRVGTVNAAGTVVAGAVGDLTKAGVITIKGSATGEELSTKLALSANTTVSGIDVILLNAGVNYKLTAAQAALSRVVGATGTTSAPGVLTSDGTITVDAPASGATPVDLSAIVLDRGDVLQLQSGSNYILSKDQAAVAKVFNGTGWSTAGDLTAAGTVTIKASTTGSDDLSGMTATGVDAVALSVGRDYTLTTAQASIAKVAGGSTGDLSKAGTVILKPAAAEDLSSTLTGVSGYDLLQLTAGTNYTLTSAQAAISKIGTAATGNLVSAGAITIKAVASSSTNLSALTVDSGDTVILATGTSGNTYTLNVQEANVAKFGTGAAGNLTDASTVNVLAGVLGDDLSKLTATGMDAVILTAGQDYILTATQAPLAKVGVSGTGGNLVKAGTLTLRLDGTQTIAPVATWDISNLQLVGAISTQTNPVYNTYTNSSSTVPYSSFKMTVGYMASSIYTPVALLQNSSATGGQSPAGASSSTLDYLGEWAFDATSNVLQFHDGAAVEAVKLVGVNGIAANGSLFFTVS